MLPILGITEDIETLLSRGVEPEFLWSHFENADGTYTICQCVTELDSDSGFTEGNVVGVVEDREQADRICDIHNATVVRALSK
jgi:hypothetical protein